MMVGLVLYICQLGAQIEKSRGEGGQRAKVDRGEIENNQTCPLGCISIPISPTCHPHHPEASGRDKDPDVLAVDHVPEVDSSS